MRQFTEKHVIKLQAFLRDRGFFSSEVGSGKFDAETRFAWEQYVKSQGVSSINTTDLPTDADSLPDEIVKYFEASDYVITVKAEPPTSAYAACPCEHLISDPFQFQHLTSGDASSYRPVADQPSVSEIAEPVKAAPEIAEPVKAEPAPEIAEPVKAEPAPEIAEIVDGAVSTD